MSCRFLLFLFDMAKARLAERRGNPDVAGSAQLAAPGEADDARREAIASTARATESAGTTAVFKKFQRSSLLKKR